MSGVIAQKTRELAVAVRREQILQLHRRTLVARARGTVDADNIATVEAQNQKLENRLCFSPVKIS